jgi:hypothetical protein
MDEYQAIRLRVTRPQQVLSKAAINTLTAPKTRSLATLTTALRRTINTGIAEYLAAATFYTGYAQWELGNYYKNVEVAATGFNDEERARVVAGFNTYAEEAFTAARATWQALIDKAGQEQALGNDPGAQRWLQAAREAIGGNVPATPPPPVGGAEENQ